jgi:asparagine synthase (glutamine-hydrolysing)
VQTRLCGCAEAPILYLESIFMCGIAGFSLAGGGYTKTPERETEKREILIKMREAIAHRGHDQTGEYLRSSVGLSHTRLSIRDLSRGAQPMIRVKDGSEYAIVYNGEIYNVDEIAPGLQSLGCRFETTSDTEVILQAYMHYGGKCAGMLNGIFAFAIWDGAKQELFLCRDRAGVKPLFYTVAGGELIFGSEIKALFAHPAVLPKLNADSFREIFGIGPARTPGCGVFEGISELEPGCTVVFGGEGLRIKRYWQLMAAPHTDSYEETVEKVSFLVRDAIKRQLVSDVPVCAFLSGGIDSSIVTAVAAKELAAQGADLNTFSFDFTGNDKYFVSNAFQPERDRPYVDIMLKRVGTRHTYLECDEEELADLLIVSMRSKDLPGMADIDASLLYFCRLVKRGNKVALTGECADEIFGGYPWFYREELLSADTFPWSRNIDAREELLRDDMRRVLDLREYIGDIYSASAREAPTLEGEPPDEARRRRVSYLNQRWFMQTLLDRMDRASMHSGLEARVPFADHRLIEYLFNVPWDFKFRDGVEKHLLRSATADLLPPELLYRKKSPYPKTYNPGYESILRDRLRAVIENPAEPLNLLVDAERVREFLGQPADYGKPWFGQLMAGPQMMAYLLQLNDWLKIYRPEIKL